MGDDAHIAVHTATLLGGGPVDPEALSRALRLAPYLVAADGGANYAHTHKIPVNHILGDFDSLTNLEYWRKSGVILTHLDEQETTDFEKCVYSVPDAVLVGVGFVGARLDHTLAAMRTLAAYADRTIILVGQAEVIFHCPRRLSLDLERGDVVSLFPMARVDGIRSTGLVWPVDGLEFAPNGLIGTSNSATGGPMELELSGDGMLVLVPLNYLETVFSRLSG